MLKALGAVLATAIVVGGAVPMAFAADLLPLKVGGYVDQKVSCQEGGNANSIIFEGSGFHVSRALETDKLLSRHGNTFRLKVSMSDASDIMNPKSMRARVETVIIHSPTNFTLISPYGTTTYQWCSADMVL